MIKLKINDKEVQVPEGVSVMAAARMKGFDIPSMCYREGKPHFTSCMICMVKDDKTGKLFPSCSVKAVDGMEVITRDEEIEESRRMALELLLSEHVGDCEAPCQVTCPAHMDIPLMNRLLAEGKFTEALEVVKRDIALPAVFGRICPAPCEGACRRKQEDEAVSICLLKRYAGDHGLLALDDVAGQHGSAKQASKPTGKNIAIIGGGPAGLAAAYYLQLRGHQCHLYDRHDFPGGTLWREVEAGNLEEEVLRQEVKMIEETGVKFFSGAEIDAAGFREISAEADAILISTGNGEKVADWGLRMGLKGVEADKQTYQTSELKVFAAGAVLRPAKLAIRTLGQGKEAAFSIDQYLQGEPIQGEPFLFNSRFGKLQQAEVVEYMKETKSGQRIEPTEAKGGYSKEQVMEEAARCIHCDCRAIDNCKLRTLSHEYQANQKHYWSEDRKAVQKFGLASQDVQHQLVVYEPNKCVRCGICVHITEEHRDTFGMSFIGRGFDVVVNVPFNEALDKGLAGVAEEVAKACPTGAISLIAD